MIKFSFSRNQEIKDILWIYKDYQFFKKSPYTVYYPSISNNLHKILINNTPNKKIKALLDQEFSKIFQRDKKSYQQALKMVEKNWRPIEKKFFKYLAKFTNLRLLSKYYCYISRYGPGGNFSLPNIISIRAREETPDDVKMANLKIIHEIVHLLINKLVKKNNLSFEDTERLVDLILINTPIKNLLGDIEMQGFGNPGLEAYFNHYKGNIERVITAFSKKLPLPKLKNYENRQSSGDIPF